MESIRTLTGLLRRHLTAAEISKVLSNAKETSKEFAEANRRHRLSRSNALTRRDGFRCAGSAALTVRFLTLAAMGNGLGDPSLVSEGRSLMKELMACPQAHPEAHRVAAMWLESTPATPSAAAS